MKTSTANRAVRAKLLAQITLIAAAVAFLSVPAFSANTPVTVVPSGQNLDSATSYSDATLPNSTEDVEFVGPYSPNPLTFTVSGAALTMGSLDDMDTSESLIISNSSATAGSITLSLGSTNSVAPSASDLLYVESGGNLTIQSSTGVLTLNLANTGSIDNAGTLALAGPISITAGKTISFTGAGTTTVSGVIANTTGAVTINDAGGSTILSAANLYTGTTTLTNGTLDLQNQYALQNSVLNQGTGTTLIFDSSVTANAFNLAGLSGLHDIALQNGATQSGSAIVLTLGNSLGTTAAFTGALTGTGSLVKIGSNTQTLSAAGGSLDPYTFSGPTTINGGILEYGNTYAMSANSAITVNNGGELAIAVGTATGLFTNATSGSGTIGGTFSGATFNSGSFFGIDTTSATTAYAGSITGTGVGFEKLGTNTLDLTGANSFTGPTTIAAGTLQIGGTGSLGSGSYANSIYDVGTLEYSSSGAQTLSGTISGSGVLTKDTSASVLTLSGANTYTGATNVSVGTLDLANSLALQNSTLTITSTGAVTFDSSVTSDAFTLGALSDSGNITLQNNAATPVGITLTLGSLTNASTTYAGSFLAPAGGGGALTVYGYSNTITLEGTNTYTGATTVLGGTLNLGGSMANGSISSSSPLVVSGGVFSYTRSGNTTQTFASTTVGGGYDMIKDVAGDTLNLGALSSTAGGIVDFASTGGTFTTSTANTNGIIGGFATYGGLSTWAVSNGSSSPITGLATYEETTAAGITPALYLDANVDVNSSQTLTAPIDPNSLRFNTAAAETLTLTGLNQVLSGGILDTSTTAANNSTITGGYLVGAANGQLELNVGATSAKLVVASQLEDNGAARTAVAVSEPTNPGRNVSLSNINNSFSGGLYIDSGGVNIPSGAGNNGTVLGVGDVYFANSGQTFQGTGGTVAFAGNGATLSSGLLVESLVTNYDNGNTSNSSGGTANWTLIGTGTATFGGYIASYSGGRIVNFTLDSGTQIFTNGGNVGSSLVTVNGGTLQLGNGYFLGVFGNSANSMGLAVGGGNFVEYGNFGGQSTQTFNSGLTVNSGASTITVDNNTGNNIGVGTVVSFAGAGSRSVGGTVDFVLPSGAQSAINGITTVNLNTNGILGGYAVVGGTDWATNATNTSGGNIIGLSSSTINAYTADTWAAGDNTDVTMADSESGATTNSLRFAAAGANQTVTLTGINTITSGGILVASTAGAGSESISSGFGGATLEGSASGDLIINQFSTGTLTIAATIADNGGATGLTYSGPGELILTGSNTYTGGTYINDGTLNTTGAGIDSTSSTNGIFFNGGTLQLASGGLGFSTAKTLNIGVNGGTIDLDGNGATFSGNITGVAAEGAGAGAYGAFSPTGTGLFTVTNSNSSTPATLVLSGLAATYYGGMTINGNATVQDASAAAGILSAGPLTETTSGTPTLDMDGHSPTVAGLIGNGTNGIITNSAGSALSTLTLDGTLSDTYKGLIEDGTASGAQVALVVNLNNQTESQTLTNANAYSGGTTITSGILYANNGTNGSATGSGTVLVNTSSSGGTNGTLAGSGTVNGAVTLTSGTSLSAALSSGSAQGAYATENGGNGMVNGTGTGGGLTLTNNLTVNPGSTLSFALGSSTAGNVGSVYSVTNANTDSTYLKVGGTGSIFAATTTPDIVTITNLVANSATLSLTLDNSGAYLLVETTGTNAGTDTDFSNLVTTGGPGANGTVLGVSNGSGSYTPITISMFDANGITQNASSDQLYLDNGDLLLTAAVPEPSEWSLLGLSMVALVVVAAMRRRMSDSSGLPSSTIESA